jgi:DNA-nicking Smr family endonuclease
MTRRLTPEERRLWSRVARTVRPAPGKLIADPEEPAEEIMAAPRAGIAPPSQGVSRPTRPGAPEDLSGQRKIRRGQHVIDARLDLHGHTQDTAHRELAEFLLRQARNGARCVLVITGKGRPNQGRMGAGILRARLFDWIADPELRPFIAGYAAAHPRHGGAGATYIFLRSAGR